MAVIFVQHLPLFHKFLVSFHFCSWKVIHIKNKGISSWGYLNYYFYYRNDFFSICFPYSFQLSFWSVSGRDEVLGSLGSMLASNVLEVVIGLQTKRRRIKTKEVWCLGCSWLYEKYDICDKDHVSGVTQRISEKIFFSVLIFNLFLLQWDFRALIVFHKCLRTSKIRAFCTFLFCKHWFFSSSFFSQTSCN